MAEKEAVERQLQARRAVVEARRDERERLSGEMGGEGEVCGREVGGEAGEGSEDPERAEVVPVRGPVLTLERPCQLLEHSLGQHQP